MSNPTTPTLQSAANQIFSVVAPTTSRLARIQVTVSDEASTASTDGVIAIRMPTTFCGEAVAESAPIAVGLLAHEVGHFLQPLAEIVQVEQEHNVPHWLANVALDIHDETLMQLLFPALDTPFYAVRRAVKNAHEATYRRAIETASTFTQAAANLALQARFTDPDVPFSSLMPLPPGCPFGQRADAFLAELHAFAHLPAPRLPDALRKLLRTFPELAETPVPEMPLGDGVVWVDANGRIGEGVLAEAQAQASSWGSGGGGNASVEKQTFPVNVAPLPEALRYASAIRPRFQSARGGIEVIAPGRFDRRAAARGEIPFRLAVQGKEVPAPRLLLLLDVSPSMNAAIPGTVQAKKEVALIAAQAVALAVTRSGGDVVGVLFASRAVQSQRADSSPLFAPTGAGGGTCFRFLPGLWRAYPHHRVLLITDGVGSLPPIVTAGDRARTSAIVIPDGNPDHVRTLADRLVVLDDVRKLPAVVAMLVQRSEVA